MKQEFVVVADGFQVRFEKREKGAIMTVLFAYECLSQTAQWDDKTVLLRVRISGTQSDQLADWLSDRSGVIEVEGSVR